MVSVDTEQLAFKQIIFTNPKTKEVVLRRDAIFAHRCPKCSTIIQGLIVHKPDEALPEAYRQPDGHPKEIQFKLFAEPGPGFVTVPAYAAPMVDLGHQCGQYFYDSAHFAQAGYAFYGRCKYSRAVFQFDENKPQEALRLAGILKMLYGTDDLKWASLREQLETVPGLAEVVIGKVLANAGVAPDVVGNNRPTYLISKDDWDYKSFGALVDECLEWAAPKEGVAA